MQKNAITICSYVCVASAFCAFFRWIQNQAAFEAETGLMIPGSFWTKFSILACLVGIAGIWLVVRNLWYREYYPAQEFEVVIHGKRMWLYRISRAIAGLMIIGAILTFFIAGYELYSSLVRTLCFLGIAAAWAFVKISELPFEEEKSPMKQTLYAALPAVMYAYWLVISYRTHAAIPSVWSYAPEVFAICASVLGLFYFAGYGFDYPRPYAAIGWMMTGSFLSLVSLMDSRNVGLSLMFVAGAAMQLYFVWMILTSMSEQWPEEAEAAE